MAGSCSIPQSQTSTPPSDPLFHSDPPYSSSNPTSPPCLPAARLVGAFLSGGSGNVPVNVNETSGSGGGGGGSRGSGCSGGGSGAAPLTDCTMVEVHGVKVASFSAGGVELICLPQVFELFLKHLVGGLHTVYTKLKRLHISPVVCSVEQVRVLRGLGAIQPGVNRCKLITRDDFETLLRDCTNASSRPGRPPKRMLGMTTMADGSRLLPLGLVGPALLAQTGLTAAAMAEALKLQKMRMMIGFHSNSDPHRQHNGAESEIDDTGGSEGSWEKEQQQRLLLPPSSYSSSSSGAAPPAGSLHLDTLQQHNVFLANRLSDFPFMVMPHPLLPVGLPPASVAMAMNQMSKLSGFANMAVVSHVPTEESKDSPPGSPSPSPSDCELHQSDSRASSSSSTSPPPAARTPELADSLLTVPPLKPTYEKLPLISQPQPNSTFAPFLLAEGLSSMETLLTNIQGLLKVAVESTRSQDKHNQLEREELKLELKRERDARQTLQRQLSFELQTRVSVQRRLKKEKKARRKLQEAFEEESRGREQRTNLHCSSETADLMN